MRMNESDSCDVVEASVYDCIKCNERNDCEFSQAADKDSFRRLIMYGSIIFGILILALYVTLTYGEAALK